MGLRESPGLRSVPILSVCERPETLSFLFAFLTRRGSALSFAPLRAAQKSPSLFSETRSLFLQTGSGVGRPWTLFF
jgi:hypothetical protein